MCQDVKYKYFYYRYYRQITKSKALFRDLFLIDSFLVYRRQVSSTKKIKITIWCDLLYECKLRKNFKFQFRRPFSLGFQYCFPTYFKIICQNEQIHFCAKQMRYISEIWFLIFCLIDYICLCTLYIFIIFEHFWLKINDNTSTYII